MIKLKKVWREKWKILEGLWYNHIVFFFNKTHWAVRQVDQRRDICSDCPNLDLTGTGPNVVIKGHPACAICGCNIKELTACLSCSCSLTQIGQEPNWKPIKVKNDYKIESKIETKDKRDDKVY